MPAFEERASRRSSGESDSGVPATWDTAAVAAALGSVPDPRTDAVLGQGAVFRLSHTPPLDLELYEHARTVRLTSGEVQITLSTQDGPWIAAEGIIFAQPNALRPSSLSLTARGEVKFSLAPPARMPQEPESGPEPTSSRPTPPELLRNDSATRQHTSSERSPADDESGAEQERVRLSGRLGTDPRFRETRTGVLIGSFPLGISQADGTTTWEQVVVFRERAEQLRSASGPRKGQAVEVIGYRHRREQPNKQGRTKVIEEVYAVMVKSRHVPSGTEDAE